MVNVTNVTAAVVMLLNNTSAPTSLPSPVPTPMPTAMSVPSLQPTTTTAAPTTSKEPTAVPTTLFAGKKSSKLRVKDAVHGLDWSDILLVARTAIPAGIVLFCVYLLGRRSKKGHELVYYPRAQWERLICEASKGVYQPLERAPHQTRGVLDWVWSIWWYKDEEILRHAGLEMYLYIRFTRLCFRLCRFGCVTCSLMLTCIYSRTPRPQYGRRTWNYLTLANVDSEEHPNRLWPAALFMYLVSLQCILACANECVAYVELRQSYFTHARVNAVPERAEQSLRTVLVERLPENLRSSRQLKLHFAALFGAAKVHSASVPSVQAATLAKLHRQREGVARQLERALLRREQHINNHGEEQKDVEAPSSSPFSKRKSSEDVVGSLRSSLVEINTRLVSLVGRRPAQERRWTRELLLHNKACNHARQGVAQFAHTAQYVKAGISGRRASRHQLGDGDDSCSPDTPARPVEKSKWKRRPRLRRVTGWLWKQFLRASGLDLFLDMTQTVGTSLAKKVRHNNLSNEDSGGCSTGFVTFADVTTANLVRQMQLESQPNGMWAYHLMPDTSDIIWANVAVPKDTLEMRSLSGAAAIRIGAVYWVSYVSFLYSLSSVDTLERAGLVQKDRGEQPLWVKYFTSHAPVVLLSSSLALLPALLRLFSVHYEQCKLESSVELRVLKRNFMLQMLNLYTAVIAGSVYTALNELIKRPTAFFELIAASLPMVSAYFVELIIIKTFIGLFVELSRVVENAQVRFALWASGGVGLAPRDEQDESLLTPRFAYGTQYTNLLMIAIIAILFSVIAPLVYLFSFLFFAIALAVHTHNALHVYVPLYETGGIFFFPVLSRLLMSLVLSQVTLGLYLALKAASTEGASYVPSFAVACLPVATLCFKEYIQKVFEGPCKQASLERVIKRDAALLTSDFLDKFDPNLYAQPAMNLVDELSTPRGQGSMASAAVFMSPSSSTTSGSPTVPMSQKSESRSTASGSPTVLMSPSSRTDEVILEVQVEEEEKDGDAPRVRGAFSEHDDDDDDDDDDDAAVSKEEGDDQHRLLQSSSSGRVWFDDEASYDAKDDDDAPSTS